MTVKMLKEILLKYNDDDRVILDNGHYEADSQNEVLYAIKLQPGNAKEPLPVVVLQTRDDFDVPEELEASLEYFQKENYGEADALSELFEMGYTLDDFKYDKTRHEWAKQIGR